MSPVLVLLAGLVVLALGGDWLIRGATGLAERLRVPPLVIGLTIVAMGTSAPELLVSLGAAFEGSGGIAIGNVVGSNIANILVVLALPALLAPTPCDGDGVGRNLVVMLAVTAIFMVMLGSGHVGRIDGLILLVIFAWFLRDQLRAAQAHRDGVLAREEAVAQASPRGTALIGAMIAAGLVALPVGARLTVVGASEIASALGVSDAAIGLTVVAVGTSLPELTASLLAMLRRTPSVAIGNVIGSNIFNIVFIMGATATLFPLEVPSRIAGFDMWVMAATAVLVAVLSRLGIAIARRAALAMLGAYLVYVAASFAF